MDSLNPHSDIHQYSASRTEIEHDEEKTLSHVPSNDKHDIGFKAEDEITDPSTFPQPESLQVDDEYPDGGLRAWLVVIGTMCVTFSTFGFVNAWGVFQSFYQHTTLRQSTPSNIAWIGSIQYSLVFIPGVISGRMFDLGYFKLPLFIASCLLVGATILVAECSQYWQFLICQGLAIGVGCGMIFGSAMGAISHWFRKRRGTAVGLTATGSSIGGTIFPIAADRLIKEVGFQWAMRILGLVLMVALGCANLTLARRLPPVNVKGGLLNPAAFKNKAYSVWCLSGFIAFLGLYTVLTYIDTSSVLIGIKPDFAFYLISISNASSGVGRISSGFLADRFGAINIMVPFTLFAAITTYVWPFAATKGSLIVIAIFYGFGSGAFVSLIAIPPMAFGETQDVGRRVGMSMTVFACGALAGPPISGAINQATGGFKVVGYFSGSMVVASVALMVLCRQLHLKRVWGKF